MFLLRVTGLVILLFASFAVVASDVADARAGRGKSFGSRGTRTYDAAPATNTAPRGAPVDQSMTARNAAQAPGMARPSMFGGWRGLLMGGLFAAALGGIFGFGALASGLGFLLQIALIGGVIFLIYAWFKRRNQPAMAGMPHGMGGGGYNRADSMHGANQFRGQGVGSGGFGSAGIEPLQIGQADLENFEKLLGEIQTAYGREDVDALGARVTPEMLAGFMQELDELAKRGLRNQISDVKLLQGDIAESWRENGTDYATVAIRYGLIDVTLDRATGKVVDGDATRPTEATELWTFRRDGRGGAQGWQLSAIQQTA